jgi:hypothetical protein
MGLSGKLPRQFSSLTRLGFWYELHSDPLLAFTQYTCFFTQSFSFMVSLMNNDQLMIVGNPFKELPLAFL